MVPGDPHKAAGHRRAVIGSRSVTDRLLLLDGHSLAYRAFFALPVENFATTTGPAHQRRLRLHRDADQRPAGREADAGRGGVRPVRADLQARAVRRVQGRPDQGPGRVPQPDQPDLRGARRARHPAPVRPRLRGRRHHRHPRHPGQRGGRRRPHRHRRPRHLPAHRRPRDRALQQPRRVRHEALRPRLPGREVRADPGTVPRLRRPARRPERQPALHPRRRREDRDQVDRRVRLAREPGQPGRRGQGQGRRRAPREPRQRAPQPPAHPAASATCRPRRSARRRTTWRPPGPTATRSTTSSTPCSSGCCATGSTRPSPTACPARPPRAPATPPPKIKSSGASRSTRPSSPRDRSPPGWKTIGRSNGPGWHWQAAGPVASGWPPRSRSPPPTARARSSTRPS